MSLIGLIFTVSGLVVLSAHGNYWQVNEVFTSLYLKKVGAECTLKGHVIEKSTVTSLVECGLKCLSLLPDCKSLNYVTVYPSKSAICEINNSSKSQAHKDDFIRLINSEYFEPVSQPSSKKSFTDGPWTLIARFSNNDAKKWMEDNETLWYDREEAYGNTFDPSDNADMISEGFWLQQGSEFKITKSNDPNHTALLTTSGNCLNGMTFRDKMKHYGVFRDTMKWANNMCLGNCSVRYGGNYTEVEGFGQSQCDGEFQAKDKIGFWCDYRGKDGSVIMIGGGGPNCSYTGHGIGITATPNAKFGPHNEKPEYDFGNDPINDTPTELYSLNLWVRLD